MQDQTPYSPKHKVRIVTAASLFDGHDAAINVMRRIIQASGCEVIHLGHDRSAEEVVNTAIQEDANAIAMTSYQGGHNEYFKYMRDLLVEKGASHIQLFGGGGGTILPEEIEKLEAYGIAKIYHPDDGRSMGLQGMINDLIQKSDFATGQHLNGEIDSFRTRNKMSIARIISAAENFPKENKAFLDQIQREAKTISTPVLGITGTGGAGKSSLVDELVRRFLLDFPKKNIAIISVDPSKRKTGGALLGDRIRMNSIRSERVYMRSLATRQANLALSAHIDTAKDILKVAGYDLIILETSGIGQSDTEITDHSDVSLYVMTPEYGAATQLEKIDMLDFADVIALNKFDKRGALDALRDVKKQFQRNHQLFDQDPDKMPVFGTIASQFNDPGVNSLYATLIKTIQTNTNADLNTSYGTTQELSEKIYIIPPKRVRYLSEIAENNRSYNQWAKQQANIAQKLFGIHKTIQTIQETAVDDSDRLIKDLKETYARVALDFDPKLQVVLDEWDQLKAAYANDIYTYLVRGREIKVETKTTSLSHQKISKVSLPKYEAWGDILQWNLQENVPGKFPFTAGIYPFKRQGEDPTRMFAGEGGPERTNKRFHYLSSSMPAKRLSTAFDSVTLYGNDPDHRPDIYGKIGNAGVSICCLDDAKKLYSGFNLANPMTSVSMTINGPAPMLLGYFMNAAIDQQCELYIHEQGIEKEIKAKIDAFFNSRGIKQPQYEGELPVGNNGLGLMLLGVTGDMVLPSDIYSKIKADTLNKFVVRFRQIY